MDYRNIGHFSIAPYKAIALNLHCFIFDIISLIALLARKSDNNSCKSDNYTVSNIVKNPWINVQNWYKKKKAKGLERQSWKSNREKSNIAITRSYFRGTNIIFCGWICLEPVRKIKISRHKTFQLFSSWD